MAPATSAASAVTADLGQPEQPDAGDLAGEQVAGRHAGEEDLDGPTRLLLDHAAQHHRPVGADGHEEHERQDEGGGLVVRASPRHSAQFDVLDRHGRDHGQQVVGADAGGERRARCTATSCMAPVTTAWRCSSARRCHSNRWASTTSTSTSPSRTASCPAATVSYRRVRTVVPTASPWAWIAPANSVGTEPVRPTVLRAAAGVEQGGKSDHRGDADGQQDQGGEEGAGPAAFAYLPHRDQPALPRAVHAATASRNSSANVGGW